MSVVAQDNITISGETLYEFYHDLDSEYGWNGDAEIMVQAVVDDYNTANVKIEYVQGGVSYDAAALGGPVISIIDEGGPSYMELNRGYFTTALGKYVGLEDMGVTITVDWGYNEFDDPSYGQITAYAIEDIWEAKKETWGVGIDVGIMDMVHIETWNAPAPGVNQNAFGVYADISPVMVSAYYDRNGALEWGDGVLGVTVAGGMDVMPGMFAFEAALNFAYYMDPDIESGDDDLATEKYMLSFALHTEIMEMAYFDAAFIGEDDSIFEYLFFALGVGYMDMVGVDVGIGLIVDDDAAEEMFDEFDVGVWTKVGAAKFRVGYIYHADQAPGANFYEGLDKNLGMGISYDTSVAENGVIYFGGELDY
jgi:hypothetical protein